MSYEYDPKWVELEYVENFLQVRFNADTKPSDAEVYEVIEEVETSMLARNLGSQTTPALTRFDVPGTEGVGKDTVAWFAHGFPSTEVGRIVIPPYVPIISVNSGTVSRNKATLSQTPSWDLLVCKDNLTDADDTDFLIGKVRLTKPNKIVGMYLYFYGDGPEAGRERLRGTWVYGYNIDDEILRRYGTLKVAEEIIFRMLRSGQPPNLASFRGGDLTAYVNTDWTGTLAYIQAKCEEIERLHFPSEIPISVAQGI